MKNLPIIAIFTATFLCCCSSKQEDNSTSKTIETTSICGKWELTKINGDSITLNEDEEQAFVIFNIQDSTIAVFDGCNNISGDIIEAENGNLVLSVLSSTLQYCEEQGESAKLGNILNVANKYEIKECAEKVKYLTISSSKDSISATFKAIEIEEQE